MVKIRTIGASLATVFAMTYGGLAHAIPKPGAVADAYLELSNFYILAGNHAAGVSGTALDIKSVLNPAGTITLGPVNTTAEVAGSLNGVGTPLNKVLVGLGAPFAISSTLGTGYTPYTRLTGNPGPDWIGASTKSTGDGLTIGSPVDVPVESQVSLASYGSEAGSSAYQNLQSNFSFALAAGQLFELSFDADGFLRTALGQSGIVANAKYNWTASVDRINKVGPVTHIMTWNPDGEVGSGYSSSLCHTTKTDPLGGGKFDCNEYADAFLMNDGLGTNGAAGESLTDASKGPFEMELYLAAGTYNFTIQHNTHSDAAIGVPEPTTLALLGLGMLGLGAKRRRQI